MPCQQAHQTGTQTETNPANPPNDWSIACIRKTPPYNSQKQKQAKIARAKDWPAKENSFEWSIESTVHTHRHRKATSGLTGQ
jgi:hypothetical protein